MNKHVVRFFALILIPCVLVDPAIAGDFHNAFSSHPSAVPSSVASISGRFQEEALQCSALFFLWPVLTGNALNRKWIVSLLTALPAAIGLLIGRHD